jgi:hypothetical protein
LFRWETAIKNLLGGPKRQMVRNLGFSIYTKLALMSTQKDFPIFYLHPDAGNYDNDFQLHVSGWWSIL